MDRIINGDGFVDCKDMHEGSCFMHNFLKFPIAAKRIYKSYLIFMYFYNF